MRVMVMHRNNDEIRSGAPPRKELIEDMGALVGGLVQAGTLVEAAGLLPRGRTRVRGKTVQSDPAPDHELPASFVMVKVDAMPDAIRWGERLAAAAGPDAEVEVGPVTEAWDIGLAPKPEGDVPVRCLLVQKADARTERAGGAPEGTAKVVDEMKKAGVLLRTIAMAPSKDAKRLVRSGGKITITDGPFAESRELVGGFTVLETPSMADALRFAERYAEILGEIVVDVRPVVDVGP